MKPGRRYHTPELSLVDRLRLWSFLGWEQALWGLVEHQGAHILNCQFHEAASESRWQSQWPLTALPEPTVIFGYRSILPLVPALEGHDLWRELLPHPLNLIRSLRGETEISFSSEAFAQEIAHLEKAFARLEESLLSTEFTLLTFSNPTGSLSLLIHAVRGRCVRLGTSPEVHALATDSDTLGEWSAPVRRILVRSAHRSLGLNELSEAFLTQIQPVEAPVFRTGLGAETCKGSDFLIPT